ncbi:MAG TPA: NifU family protein [Candidatus Azoamicus sp. MARI]
MSVGIILTNDALTYLYDKLNTESNSVDCCIYISVIYPYTRYAHVNITFCNKSDLNKEDIKLLSSDHIYVDGKSLDLLDKSIVDVKNNSLLINAPYIFNSSTSYSSDIKHSIKHLFENEINVILSQHGGFIDLIDVVDDTLIIKFHGGCQGCGMVGYTLNNYIEKIIKKNFPQIKIIKDVTSHDVRKNAYY